MLLFKSPGWLLAIILLVVISATWFYRQKILIGAQTETIYLADELPFSRQTAGSSRETIFQAETSGDKKDGSRNVIQIGPGSISFLLELKERPRFKTRFNNDSDVHALISIESDFPAARKMEYAVTANQSASVDLTELQKQIVKITLSVKNPESTSVDQRLLWIDPRVEQRFVTSNDPTDLLKKFRERHARDNVLIFLFDAVNVSHVGCYGSSTGATPNMDAIASEGIVWEQAFTPAVYTIASTGSLFTGLHPMEHGVLVHTDSLPDPFTTMAEMFRAGGYETGLFSGTGYASPVFGYGQGFNKVWIPKAPVIDAKEFVPVLSDWITKSKEDPFFGYIHFREPHYPFQPPEEFLKRFNASLDFRLPITANSINRSDEEKRNMIAAYNANLAYVDQQFGRILEVLRSQGLYDRTILVLISDHGEAFWEHGMQGHNASVYEEMIRIPMIMRIPRESSIQGTRRTQIVENTALFPTFLDLFSFSAKQIRPLRKSLLPVLLNKDAEPPEPVLFSQTAGRGSFGIRTPRFKFIERRPERLQDELYDLSTDPGERNNLLQKHPILGAYFKTVFQKRYKEWEKSLALIQTLKKKAVIDQETEEQLRALGYIN